MWARRPALYREEVPKDHVAVTDQAVYEDFFAKNFPKWLKSCGVRADNCRMAIDDLLRIAWERGLRHAPFQLS
jgi:hypothetical protein